MTEVPYGRYDEAYRAIHSALMNIAAPPAGRKITRLAFTWNPDGTLSALTAYDNGEAIFSLAFIWNVDGTLKEAARSQS
jgi:beta-mannanase